MLNRTWWQSEFQRVQKCEFSLERSIFSSHDVLLAQSAADQITCETSSEENPIKSQQVTKAKHEVQKVILPTPTSGGLSHCLYLVRHGAIFLKTVWTRRKHKAAIKPTGRVPSVSSTPGRQLFTDMFHIYCPSPRENHSGDPHMPAIK